MTFSVALTWSVLKFFIPCSLASHQSSSVSPLHVACVCYEHVWIFGLHDGFPESEDNTPLPLRKGSSKPHSKIQVQRELYDTLIVATLQNLLRQTVLRKTTKNHQKQLRTCGRKR